MDMIEIQYQDVTGNWRMYCSTINNSYMIITAMQNASMMYVGSRIRAVDGSGRVVDML